MATYTIVGNETDPLGPDQVYAGDIKVADGDIFVIDPSAKGALKFISPDGGPVDFDIRVEQSNQNKLQFQFENGQNLTMDIADDVKLPNTAIDARKTDSINLEIGDHVLIREYEGSDSGADNIVIGDGFTALGEWKTGGGDDHFRVGDNAFIKHLNTGEGDDTIIIGADANIDLIDGSKGEDSLRTQTKDLDARNIEKTEVVCYASGTLIDTPEGPRDVASLRAGDCISTLDSGAQKILWIHHAEQPLETVEKDARPVLIRAGALGPGVPARDLIVSPQHRILVGEGGQLQDRFASAAFAPAKSLVSLRGVRQMMGKRRITWIHFACERHEVVVANGCLSESLLLGPMVMNGLPEVERRALQGIYGTQATPGAALNGPAARECLGAGAARRQLAAGETEEDRQRAREISKWDQDLAAERQEAASRLPSKGMPETRRDLSAAA